MKNSNSKTFVAVGIGAALFLVLGRVVARSEEHTSELQSHA